MDRPATTDAKVVRTRGRLRHGSGAAAALLLLVGSGSAAARAQAAPDPVQVAIAAGAGAKLLCSGVFVSGRPQDDVVAGDIIPLSPAAGMLSFEVDRASGTASAKAGPLRRTATFRAGKGCTLDLPAGAARPADAPAAGQATPPVAATGAMAAAMEAAMADPAGSLRTRAIVVMQHGRIVAERYAPGFAASTPLLGWSMSKSITAAVAGMLVADGRMRLDDPIKAPEWKAGDPRAAITLRHGLQMTSGLTFVEDYTPGNDSTRMLFTAGDMAAYAAAKPALHAPGTHWSYSSGSTNIVARAIAAKLGGAEATQAYMRDRLFRPLGMTSVSFEEDAAGTPVGSSYVYASARDWGRFGQLFLGRGEVDGRVVLRPDWIDFVRTAASADRTGNYGGSFWLNGRARKGDGRRFPHLPADAYFAQGHNGQVVAIVPSHDAVLVRMGWTTGDADFDVDGHFARMLAALPDRPAR